MQVELRREDGLFYMEEKTKISITRKTYFQALKDNLIKVIETGYKDWFEYNQLIQILLEICEEELEGEEEFVKAMSNSEKQV